MNIRALTKIAGWEYTTDAGIPGIGSNSYRETTEDVEAAGRYYRDRARQATEDARDANNTARTYDILSTTAGIGGIASLGAAAATGRGAFKGAKSTRLAKGRNALGLAALGAALLYGGGVAKDQQQSNASRASMISARGDEFNRKAQQREQTVRARDAASLPRRSASPTGR